MFLFNAILIASVLGFLLHWWLDKRKRTPAKVYELALLYQLVFNIGFLGFFSFIGLTFLPGVTASYLGWPTCPFQQELGNVNLAFGVLGILCIWIRGYFWVATIIGAAIWLFADGIGHLVDAVAFGNQAPGNQGILLYSDLLLPIILVGLLLAHDKALRSKR